MGTEVTRRRMAPATFLLVVSVAAFIVYLAMNHLMLSFVLDQFFERGVVKSSVYLAWIACGFVGFFALMVTAGRVALWIFLLLFLVSLVTNYAYIVIAKTMLNVDVAEWLPHEMGKLPNAWQEFQPELVA